MFKMLLWGLRCGLIAGVVAMGMFPFAAEDSQSDTGFDPTFYPVYVTGVVLISVAGGSLSALASRGHIRPTAVVLAAWTWSLAALGAPATILLALWGNPLILMPACVVGLTAVTRAALDKYPAVTWAYATIVAVLGGVGLAQGVNKPNFPLVLVLGFPPLTTAAPLTAAVLLAGSALYERLRTR